MDRSEVNPRQALSDDLSRYARRYPAEEETAERIARLVNAQPNCAHRDCAPGHLTGSAWVVSRDGCRHLLLLHKKLGKWLQPGGHADGDFDLGRVALREAAEESGLAGLELVVGHDGERLLDLDVHVIPARTDASGALIEPQHEHHDFRYLVRACASEKLVISEESHELRWCNAAEVRRLTQERSVLRLVEKAQQRLAQLTESSV